MTAIEKLTSHLQEHWKRYVLPESSNRDRIILHGFEGLWVAFEKSAYFLYESCPGSMLMVAKVQGNPFPLIVCLVRKEQLAIDPQVAQYKESGLNLRILTTTLQLTHYPEWLHGKISDSKAYGSSNCYFEVKQGVSIRPATQNA